MASGLRAGADHARASHTACRLGMARRRVGPYWEKMGRPLAAKTLLSCWGPSASDSFPLNNLTSPFLPLSSHKNGEVSGGSKTKRRTLRASRHVFPSLSLVHPSHSPWRPKNLSTPRSTLMGSTSQLDCSSSAPSSSSANGFLTPSSSPSHWVH